MTALDDRIRARAKALIGKVSKTVVIRRVSTTPGPTPAINPPSTGAFLVVGGGGAGATTISFKANGAIGRLVAGDGFRVAGDATLYTVAAQIAASGGQFTGVSFAPALTVPAADGAAVTCSFAADITLRARINGYPANLVDGTLIKQTDIQLMIAASDLPFDLTPGVDRVIVGGTLRSIVSVGPAYVADQPAFWSIQAR